MIILIIVGLWGGMVGVMSHLVSRRKDVPRIFIATACGMLLLAVVFGTITADVSSTVLQKTVFVGVIFIGMCAGHFFSSLVHEKLSRNIR